MFRWLLDLFSLGHGVKELARRLDVTEEQLHEVSRSYREFAIKKRSGKYRKISAPNDHLKSLQRRILRRLLKRLRTHPAATGFQPGVSFVDNARCHECQNVVIRIDLVDFFPSTTRDKIYKYFRYIGWNRKAAGLLADLTTHDDCLPQGAPTSPRLSNLVNYLLDVGLSNIARRYEAVYTRYADDITMSLNADYDLDDLIRDVTYIIRRCGYKPHIGKKFRVLRQHHRQTVTGLVVNQRANLPREKRRWLRAVEHRTKLAKQGGYLGPQPTLTQQQLNGWRALQKMIISR